MEFSQNKTLGLAENRKDLTVRKKHIKIKNYMNWKVEGS